MAFLPEVVSNGQLGPVPKAAIDKFGKDWVKPGNMVSNGAFVLKEWQVNSKVVLAKNPQYWDNKNVQLTRVTYLPIEDGFADVKMFLSGENDWVYQLPPGTYEKYKAELIAACEKLGAALIAVKRRGRRVYGAPGGIVLEVTDSGNHPGVSAVPALGRCWA